MVGFPNSSSVVFLLEINVYVRRRCHLFSEEILLTAGNVLLDLCNGSTIFLLNQMKRCKVTGFEETKFETYRISLPRFIANTRRLLREIVCLFS